MISGRLINLLLLASMVLVCSPGVATVVRMDVAVGGQPAGSVYIELFDAATPMTVANFLNYAENGGGERRYDGTFIHRVVSGFVVQGGGFAYDPAAGAFSPATAPHIQVDAPVANEFDVSRSNLRGTIAMAKVGGDPDSATSEWFFNLNDNSANLDNQNGGFTVFGRVLGSGMTLVDDIAGLARVDAGAPFTDLPVVGSANPVTELNLVYIGRVVVNPPAALSVPDSFEIGDTRQDQDLTALLPIANTGAGDLFVSSIEIVGPDAALFSVTNVCLEFPIPELARCDEAVTFTPNGLGEFQATLRITTIDPGQPAVEIPLSATAGLDGDGIPDWIEQAGRNNGDGNLDGVADVLQEHVASFPTMGGEYVTLVTSPGLLLSAVRATGSPSPASSIPTVDGGTLDFRQDFFSFEIENVPVGGAAEVTLILPPGQSANSYFKFGRLPGEDPLLFLEHWYTFDFDSRSQTGAEFEGGQITLHFVDGGRGDNDQAEDGRIVDPGGPAVFSVAGSGSSASGGGCSSSDADSRNGLPLPVDFVLLLGLLVLRSCLSRARISGGV